MKYRCGLLILCLFVLGGCAKTSTFNTVELTLVPELTQTVELAINQTLIAEIPANLTTGYRWELKQLTRERRCYLFTELEPLPNTEKQGEPMRMGAPSVQRWSIKIDPRFPCSKDQLISWTYRRAWEPLNTQDTTTRVLLKPVSDSISSPR